MVLSVRRAVRVLLADDHQVLLEALKLVLAQAECQVVAVARNGVDAVRLADECRPDVAVLDIVMPLLDGFMAAKEIQRRVPGVGVVFLTGLDDADVVDDARAVGVRAVVSKAQPVAELVRAIEAAAQGGEFGLPAPSPARGRDLLTPRERQVLRLIAVGHSTKQVAGFLGVSFKTAESHRTRLMRKLDIHETAGLVRYAVRRGLDA
jgi:DNA-binding NarL/FixJ family response regulator